MLKLIRSGHKSLIIETKKLDDVIEFLKEHCTVTDIMVPGPKTFEQMDALMEQTHENHVVIFTVHNLKENLQYSEFDAMISIEAQLHELLMEIINLNQCNLITNSRVGPELVIMQLVGDERAVIDAIKQDFPTTSGNLLILFSTFSSGTIIALTKANISKPATLETIYPIALYTKAPFKDVFHHMQHQNLKYLNAGLHNEDWYELKIKIYDAYGRFDLHYNRLSYIFDKLNLGLILGESWGTDAATIFLSVGIYKVRFFTFYNPIRIKRILLGLEFMDDGTRVVDYDIYYKRRKIHWDALRDREHKSRESLSHKFRQEILSQLTEEEVRVLYRIEKEILESRNI